MAFGDYRELSLRYMKHNRKRTGLALLGIILSMALVSTICLFITGVWASQLQQARLSSGMGAHIVFEEPDEAVACKVKNNPNVQSYGYMKRGGVIAFGGGLSFQEYTADEAAARLLAYSLRDGRTPAAADEICIDEWVKVYMGDDLSLGDTITLGDGKYTIVGFLKNQINNQKTKVGRAVLYDAGLQEGQLLVELRDGRMFNETLETLQGIADSNEISVNDELVRVQQLKANDTLAKAGLIAMLIAVACTVIVIYNAFQISLVERVRQFGILKSIGATKKQIRNLVFQEAAWMCLLAVPAGALLSIGVIYALQGILNLLMEDNKSLSVVSIDPRIFVFTALLTIAAVYASCLATARYVSNLPPLAAVNSSTMLKKENPRKKRFRFITARLNFKAGLALKNVWRNPKRGMAMLLSVTVSAALFITFTTLTEDVISLQGTSYAYQNIDLEISLNEEQWGKEQKDSFLSEASSALGGENIYLSYPQLQGQVILPEEKQIPALSGIYQQMPETGQACLYGRIGFYDDGVWELVNRYLGGDSIDSGRVVAENGIVLVANGNASDYVTKKRYAGQLSGFEEGDAVTINGTDGNVYEFKILGIVENDLLERDTPANSLSFLSSNALLEKLAGDGGGFTGVKIDLADNGKHFEAARQIDAALKGYPYASVTDYVDINRSEKNSVLLIQILVYGFILVITAISATNIINTITMNITLRKRELSVLKSIGMSQQDLKKMILYEGLFYGLAGGVIGSLCGGVFTYVIYHVLSEAVGLEWHMPLGLSLAAIGAAVLISFLSVLPPLKKVGRNNIIEEIRME